MPRPAAQ